MGSFINHCILPIFYIFHSFPASLNWVCVFRLIFKQSSFKVLQLQINVLLVIFSSLFISGFISLFLFVCLFVFCFFVFLNQSQEREQLMLGKELHENLEPQVGVSWSKSWLGRN